MNILFLTLVKINSISSRDIYTDLLREFISEGHRVTIICPIERREGKKSKAIQENNSTILHIKTLNIQKANLIEKGLGTLAIEYQFLNAIKTKLKDTKFDLVLYATPPITFVKVIEYVKKRDNAFAYLLLKDIFPQNAVDMKMIKEKSILHKLFQKKEKNLYNISDKIGCMSEANRNYILKHNPYIKPEKVEINPNSIQPITFNQTDKERITIRQKYELPEDSKIFVYGGNLGKPQGLDFLLEILKTNTFEKVFFLIIGNGTEFNKIKKWFDINQPPRAKLIAGLPKNEYDVLLQACDVGLIFLHPNFTIPNFPSRLLSYLEMRMPVIAATDSATDIGIVIEKNNCGFAIQSGDLKSFLNAIEIIIKNNHNFNEMKNNAWNLLQNEYLAPQSFIKIKNALYV